MGTIRSWKPRTERQKVFDPNHTEVPWAIQELQGRGFVKFEIHKDRFSDEWHIEAVKFVEVSE